MEQLPEELLVMICEYLPTEELARFSEVSLRYWRIIQAILDDRRENLVSKYCSKYLVNDKKSARDIIRTLVKNRASNDKYYVIEFLEHQRCVYDVGFDHKLTFFKGNAARAILKAADYLYSKVRYYPDGEGVPLNLFEEISGYLGFCLESWDLHDIRDVVSLFTDLSGMNPVLTELDELPIITVV